MIENLQRKIEAECGDGVTLTRIPLSEDHAFRRHGIEAMDVLEYLEFGDDDETRTVRVSKPAGTWTVGALAEALQVVQNTVQGRAPIPVDEEPE